MELCTCGAPLKQAPCPMCRYLPAPCPNCQGTGTLLVCTETGALPRNCWHEPAVMAQPGLFPSAGEQLEMDL